ncbi:hypothetical protein VTK73DRAFT_6886 [Phialemonium thermophilum]|uniref:Uncharacterized protein n=1 Tax=Phialemonium thermophilum TaxID=223376 RepID=A0ABR3WHS9_9PEZI
MGHVMTNPGVTGRSNLHAQPIRYSQPRLAHFPTTPHKTCSSSSGESENTLLTSRYLPHNQAAPPPQEPILPDFTIKTWSVPTSQIEGPFFSLVASPRLYKSPLVLSAPSCEPSLGGLTKGKAPPILWCCTKSRTVSLHRRHKAHKARREDVN